MSTPGRDPLERRPAPRRPQMSVDSAMARRKQAAEVAIYAQHYSARMACYSALCAGLGLVTNLLAVLISVPALWYPFPDKLIQDTRSDTVGTVLGLVFALGLLGVLFAVAAVSY